MNAWSKSRMLAYQRSGGLCEVRMAAHCTGQGEHFHHRQLRSRGGKDTAANGLQCCHECHRFIHTHVAVATEHGWIVSQWSDPAEVSLLRYRQWVFFDDEGGMRPEEATA